MEVNIRDKTLENTKFKKFLYTAAPPQTMQLAVMCLKPLQDIGFEKHSRTAQFIRVERGRGKAIIGDKEFTLSAGSSIIVPNGIRHNVINTSKTRNLHLYTVYSNDKH